jgi:hypothetical protein
VDQRSRWATLLQCDQQLYRSNSHNKTPLLSTSCDSVSLTTAWVIRKLPSPSAPKKQSMCWSSPQCAFLQEDWRTDKKIVIKVFIFKYCYYFKEKTTICSLI